MIKILLIIIGTFISALACLAQSPAIPNNLPLTGPLSSRLNSTLIQPQQQGEGRVLPDAPIPVLPNIEDGRFPCPAGIGKPCALLGGRLYFRDPSHMTEHDATLGKAMRNPLMVVGGLLNLASTIADIEGTQACLHAHTCTEGNPLFGANPSRAKAYGIGIPLTFVIYSMAALLKKNGNGNYAFAVLWGGTLLHSYEASKGFGLANDVSQAKPNSLARQRFGIVLQF